MEVRSISTAEFEGFVRRFEAPLLQDLSDYERWKGALGLLRTFWARKEIRLAPLGLEEGHKLRGVLRVLKVPFFEGKRWGGEGKERGEIQDIFLQSFEVEGLKALLAGAEETLAQEGLSAYRSGRSPTERPSKGSASAPTPAPSSSPGTRRRRFPRRATRIWRSASPRRR